MTCTGSEIMESVGTGSVKIDVEEYRADVILSRPEKRNAMNQELLSDLETALEEVDNRGDVRAMTLLGEGEIFSAGLDLDMASSRDDSESEVETDLDDIGKVIDGMAIPSVASIKGAAIAGAFELTLPVDFRVISQDAKYGVVEVRLGVFPSRGATQRLPRLVGLSKAKELVLTGEYIEPEEAERIGLVHEVVADREQTDDRAREWADRLSQNAPLGMDRARRCLNTALDMPLEEGLALESALGEELIHTDDYKEGFTARMEDREPEFTGQ